VPTWATGKAFPNVFRPNLESQYFAPQMPHRTQARSRHCYRRGLPLRGLIECVTVLLTLTSRSSFLSCVHLLSCSLSGACLPYPPAGIDVRPVHPHRAPTCVPSRSLPISSVDHSRLLGPDDRVFGGAGQKCSGGVGVSAVVVVFGIVKEILHTAVPPYACVRACLRARALVCKCVCVNRACITQFF
jgi:hypothetical protein